MRRSIFGLGIFAVLGLSAMLSNDANAHDRFGFSFGYNSPGVSVRVGNGGYYGYRGYRSYGYRNYGHSHYYAPRHSHYGYRGGYGGYGGGYGYRGGYGGGWYHSRGCRR